MNELTNEQWIDWMLDQLDKEPVVSNIQWIEALLDTAEADNEDEESDWIDECFEERMDELKCDGMGSTAEADCDGCLKANKGEDAKASLTNAESLGEVYVPMLEMEVECTGRSRCGCDECFDERSGKRPTAVKTITTAFDLFKSIIGA